MHFVNKNVKNWCFTWQPDDAPGRDAINVRLHDRFTLHTTQRLNTRQTRLKKHLVRRQKPHWLPSFSVMCKAKNLCQTTVLSITAFHAESLRLGLCSLGGGEKKKRFPPPPPQQTPIIPMTFSSWNKILLQIAGISVDTTIVCHNLNWIRSGHLRQYEHVELNSICHYTKC